MHNISLPRKRHGNSAMLDIYVANASETNRFLMLFTPRVLHNLNSTEGLSRPRPGGTGRKDEALRTTPGGTGREDEAALLTTWALLTTSALARSSEPTEQFRSYLASYLALSCSSEPTLGNAL
jgi:hypothetical protein